MTKSPLDDYPLRGLSRWRALERGARRLERDCPSLSRSFSIRPQELGREASLRRPLNHARAGRPGRRRPKCRGFEGGARIEAAKSGRGARRGRNGGRRHPRAVGSLDRVERREGTAGRSRQASEESLDEPRSRVRRRPRCARRARPLRAHESAATPERVGASTGRGGVVVACERGGRAGGVLSPGPSRWRPLRLSRPGAVQTHRRASGPADGMTARTLSMNRAAMESAGPLQGRRAVLVSRP